MGITSKRVKLNTLKSLKIKERRRIAAQMGSDATKRSVVAKRFNRKQHR